MNITKAQGRACLKALEKIERLDGGETVFCTLLGGAAEAALFNLGWCSAAVGAHNTFRDYIRHGRYCYNRRQVATALAMCVTLSGIELRYE